MKMIHKSPYLVGVASSLGATLIVGAWSLLAGWQISSLAIPLWVAIIPTALLLGAVTTLVLFLRNQPRRVLVLISAFTKFNFFADLLRDLLDELDRNGLQAVVKVPSRDFSTAAQSRILAEAVKHRRAYVGAILVTIEPKDHREELVRFVEKFDKSVVFLDTEPPWPEAEYPGGSAFVGFDNALGGRLAAEAMVAELSKLALVHSPKVLVMAGHYQDNRREVFLKYFKAAYSGADITVDTQGGFVRSAAQKLGLQHLQSAIDSGRPYDAVFCTNDAMALGVLDILSDLPTEVTSDLILIGYDGIAEAVTNIERPDIQIKNTVHQDTAELAEQAAVLLAALLDRQQPKPVTRLRPRLYRVAMLEKPDRSNPE